MKKDFLKDLKKISKVVIEKKYFHRSLFLKKLHKYIYCALNFKFSFQNQRNIDEKFNHHAEALESFFFIATEVFSFQGNSIILKFLFYHSLGVSGFFSSLLGISMMKRIEI